MHMTVWVINFKYSASQMAECLPACDNLLKPQATSGLGESTPSPPISRVLNPSLALVGPNFEVFWGMFGAEKIITLRGNIRTAHRARRPIFWWPHKNCPI